MKKQLIVLAMLAGVSVVCSSCVAPSAGYATYTAPRGGMSAGVAWTNASYDSSGFPIFGYSYGRPVYGYTSAGAPIYTIAALTALSYVPQWKPAAWYRGSYRYPSKVYRVQAPPHYPHGHSPHMRPANHAPHMAPAPHHVHQPKVGHVHQPQVGHVHQPKVGHVHQPQVGHVHQPKVGHVHQPNHVPQVKQPGVHHSPSVGGFQQPKPSAPGHAAPGVSGNHHGAGVRTLPAPAGRVIAPVPMSR